MAASYAGHASMLVIFLAATFKDVDCLKGLGRHTPPAGGSKVLYGLFPQPKDFYELFVKPSDPLLMKNVLADKDYPAYETWHDDYLRDVYGEEMVHVEKTKKENRTLLGGSIKLSQYLDVYKKQNMEIYMVQSLPKVMQDEVLVPFTLSCGGFQSSLQNVVIWFSNGGTKSVLHYDDSDNVLCLLDGRKNLVLIDKKYKELVERDGFVYKGGYSEVDVDGVEPEVYPGIMEAPWRQIDLRKGDCVYIPYRWYHHVHSLPGRNLAINFWFTHRWWFNKSDCAHVQRSDPLKAFNEYTLASPNQPIWASFLAPFAEMDSISKAAFINACRCSQVQANQVWERLSPNDDQVVTWSSVYRVDVDDLLQTYPDCFYIPVEEDEVDEIRQTEIGGADEHNKHEDESSEQIDIAKDVKMEENMLADKLTEEPDENLPDSVQGIDEAAAAITVDSKQDIDDEPDGSIAESEDNVLGEEVDATELQDPVSVQTDDVRHEPHSSQSSQEDIDDSKTAKHSRDPHDEF